MNVDSSKLKNQYDYIDKLNQKLRNQASVKEVELDNVNKLYDKKIQDERVEGYKELSSERQRTQAQLKEVYDQREEKLENLKKQLQQTTKNLEKERQNVESQHENELRDMRLTQDLKRESHFQKGLEKSQNINEKTNNMIEQIRNDYRNKLDAIESETQQHIMQAQAKHERKRLGVDKDLSKSEAAINTQNRMDELQLERERQNSLEDIKKEYGRIEADHEAIHKNEIVKQKEHNEQLLGREEKAFKMKHDKLIKEHQELMKTTRAKLENEFEKLVELHSEAKKSHAQKVDDEFYQLKHLEPTLIDSGDSYIVKIDVPEHERDQITLAPQGRELRISLNRSFEQRTEGPNGEIHKNSRSELLTRTLKTTDIMDASEITQKYENGTLNFKIAKA